MVFCKQLIFVFASFVLVIGRPQIEPPRQYDYYGLFNNIAKTAWQTIENVFTIRDGKNTNYTLDLSMSNGQIQVLFDTNYVSYNLIFGSKQLRFKPNNQPNNGNNDPNKSDKINEKLDPRSLDINFMENHIQLHPIVLPVEENNDQIREFEVTTDTPNLNKILINEEDLAIALKYNSSFYLISGASSHSLNKQL